MVLMSIIPLSDDQKQKLTDLSKAASDLIIHRARLILAYAAGKPTMQAALEAGISRGRARFWKRQFIARGMDIFKVDTASQTSDEEPAISPMGTSEGTSTESTSNDNREDNTGIQVEIPYPQPRQTIGISPDDTLVEAGRKVWLFHFALMLCHEEGTLLGQDIEELHDMRVATRRMRTVFDIFAPAFEPKIMKQYLKGLRTIGKALGEVRDLDVILGNALDYQRKMKEENRPGLEPLLSKWQQVIDKKRARMTKHLQSDAYRNFKYNFNLFLQAPGQLRSFVEISVMNSHLRDIVPVLIYGRYAAVRAYESILPSASVKQLHALRIEFKKFRYALEYFREILGENAGFAIAEIKQSQDHLGELHDTDVTCQLVSDFLLGWEKVQSSRPIAEREDPEPIVSYLASLHAERYRLIRTYPELWRKFSRTEFRQGIAQAISLL